jgi:Sec-independent protein secretion pathway component TatC
MVIISFASFYFIFTDVTEVFTVYMNLIFFLGNQILLLYFIYHFFIFFSPALFNVENNNKKFVLKLVLLFG